MVDKSVSVEVSLESSGDVKLSGDNSDFFGSLRNVLTGCEPGVFDVTVIVRDDCADGEEFNSELSQVYSEQLEGVLFDMSREGIEKMTYPNIAKRFFDVLNASCGGELYKLVEDYCDTEDEDGEDE